MPRYFDDLSLNEMLEHHDYTYMYSDDFKWYEAGRQKQELIHRKIEEHVSHIFTLFHALTAIERVEKWQTT